MCFNVIHGGKIRKMRCFIIHKWTALTEFVLAGPVFLDKKRAKSWIDAKEDPFTYSFVEVELIQ